MSGEIRQDDEVQEAIRNLFVGCVPERKTELENYWNNLSPVFQIVPDVHENERLILEAGAYRYVRFNRRVVRAFWIGAFTAWEGYRAVAESEDICAVIPMTPFPDGPAKDANGNTIKNFYPTVKVVARDLSNNVLAETTTVLPVSDENSFDHKKSGVMWVNLPP